nr:MAG TPA: hypothetical protein [Caudoviricetes sp.]
MKTASGAKRWASGTRPRIAGPSTPTSGSRPKPGNAGPADGSRSAWTCHPTEAASPSAHAWPTRTAPRTSNSPNSRTPTRTAPVGRWNGSPNDGPKHRPSSSTRKAPPPCSSPT